MQNDVYEPKWRVAAGNAVFFIIMIVANGLSILLPLNGKSQLQLSEQYANLFTPAGFTFSVWSVIYMLLLGFIIYQFVVLAGRDNFYKRKILRISPLFIGVCTCNAAWLFAWHYEYPTLSLGIMFTHLFLLILIHEKLHLAISWKPLAAKLFLDAPFSIYLGWLCVATVANSAAWCVSQGITLSFIAPQIWAAILIVVAFLIGAFYVFTKDNKFLALTIVWALYGIFVKRRQADGDGARIIVLTSALAMCILLFIVIVNVVRRRQSLYQSHMSA